MNLNEYFSPEKTPIQVGDILSNNHYEYKFLQESNPTPAADKYCLLNLTTNLLTPLMTLPDKIFLKDLNETFHLNLTMVNKNKLMPFGTRIAYRDDFVYKTLITSINEYNATSAKKAYNYFLYDLDNACIFKNKFSQNYKYENGFTFDRLKEFINLEDVKILINGDV
jgi:hypothetical protein